MNYLLIPVPYITSHGSYTQNANPTEVILTPIHLWFFFINYLYIDKVCDVCDDRQGLSYRGFSYPQIEPLLPAKYVRLGEITSLFTWGRAFNF
jgi:hypothetical protein